MSDQGIADRPARVLVLEAGRAERNYWSDLWPYRELFVILGWRDVAVQYKQTVIGLAWAVVRPLLTMVVFTVVFGRLAGLPSEGSAPYPVMVMAGMLPWFLLSSILSQGSGSLVQNGNLISKVYFPRLIVPVASSVVALVDFAVTLVLLLGMMALYRLSARLADRVPAAVRPAGDCRWHLGPALILAALNVKYRDFRFIVPFVVQFGLYVSPVGFASSVIPRGMAAGLLAQSGGRGDRWLSLVPAGGRSADFTGPVLRLSVAVSAAAAVARHASFRATEKTFADLI